MLRLPAAPPVLERADELDQLNAAWRAARSGRGSAWLLRAEAGGGKTRLAAEAARRAGARVLWGAAEPVSPPDPYLAVIAAIPGFQPAAGRAESVVRAVERLEQVAAGEPLLLVLDDLHFADEGTVAVFVRLCAVCAVRPWFILGCYRPGEGAAVLQTAATELVAQGRARRLDLAPLSRDAVGALVAGVRGVTTAPEDLQAIYADSGGNPWFVQALAEGQGAVATARDRIMLRLDRVEAAVPGANVVLAAMAPATRPLPQSLLATLCAGRVPGLRRVLAGLRDALVLRESDSGWGFRHELLRRSILEGMLLSDQQDAHRSLAEAMEGEASREQGAGDEDRPQSASPSSLLPSPFPSATLAMHYAEASDPRAVEWALRAAREAADVDAHAESLAQLERALRFPLEPAVRRATLRAAAREAWSLGRFADCRRLTEAAIAVPGATPEERSRLHQRAANAARLGGDHEEAGAHMAAAEALLEGRPVSEQTVFLATGRVLRAVRAVQPEIAEAEARRVFDLAQQLDNPARARALVEETRAHLMLAQLDHGDPAAFPVIDRIVALARGVPRLQTDIVALLIDAYAGAVTSCFHREADTLREQATAGIQRHDMGWQGRLNAFHLLEMVQRGRFADLRASLSDLSTTGDPDAVVTRIAAALCEARAGSPARARSLLTTADAGAAFRLSTLAEMVQLEISLLEGSEGSASLAARLYEGTEPRRYARVAGFAAVALAWTGQAAPPRPPWLAPSSPLVVLWEWAVAVTADDQEALRAVAARLEAMDCPYEAALALRDAGDPPAAYRALTALGAGAARATVAERLRAARLPIPRRTRAALAVDGLTATEREVVRLLATGARNEAIAASLGISIRTVETHLVRIYQKTGLRGRVALANWWRERE